MTILDTAAKVVSGDRQEQYGDATENHDRIGELWSAYLDADISAFDVVNMMILLKVARSKDNYKEDSYVDIAGYAAIAEQIADYTKNEADEFFDAFINTPVVPRIWHSLSNVPLGVKVAGRSRRSERTGTEEVVYFKRTEDGVLNRWAYESKWYGPCSSSINDDVYGPFTEVVEPIEETVEETPLRTWDSLKSVPTDLTVTCKFGYEWQIRLPEGCTDGPRWWHFKLPTGTDWVQRAKGLDLSLWDKYGPFTEVRA